MVASWGPVPHPTDDATHAPGDTDGQVCQPGGHGSLNQHRSPQHSENYNATDGRHNRADHQGWESVDRYSGPVTDTDWDENSRWTDGPGAWRQT